MRFGAEVDLRAVGSAKCCGPTQTFQVVVTNPTHIQNHNLATPLKYISKINKVNNDKKTPLVRAVTCMNRRAA